MIKVTFQMSSHNIRVDYLAYPFIVFMRSQTSFLTIIRNNTGTKINK